MDQQINFCTTPEGVHLAYSIMGEGPAMVVPPGWVTHLEVEWEIPETRSYFERAAIGNTIIRYDKHGCGLSDRERTEFSLQKEVRDLEAVVDYLELDSFALFGFSQGGPISIAYTASHPQRVTHLILYGTYARGMAVSSPEIRESLIQLIRASWGMGSSMLSEIFFPGGDAAHQAFFKRFQKKAATGEMAARLLQAETEWDVTGMLSEISRPTLVLHRKGDRAVPLGAGRELAMAIPQSRFIILDGEDHLPVIGDSGAILRAVREFLNNERIQDASGSSSRHKDYRRSLRAVLSADVQGYSLLMNGDEDATVATLAEYREIMAVLVKKHNGRVVDAIGDNLLAEFESVRDAVKCAVAVQKTLAAKNGELPENRKMKFRIGINLGDVVQEEGRIYGHGVNIAARMEGLAEGGGICISGTVYDQVENKLAITCQYLGEKTVKNIPRPVRAYKVNID